MIIEGVKNTVEALEVLGIPKKIKALEDRPAIINQTVNKTTTPTAGVTSVVGTANQVLANGNAGTPQTGVVTLTNAIPQILPSPNSGAAYYETNQNSPSQVRWGVEEGSTGGAIFTGSTAGAAVFGVVQNFPVELYQNNTKRLFIDISGDTNATGQVIALGVVSNKPSIGVTSTQGLAVQNVTAATATLGATVQYSPSVILLGHAWKSGIGAADQTVRWRNENRPVSGPSVTSNLVFSSSVDTGTPSWTDRLTLTSAGALTITGGLSATTGAFSSTLSATTGTFNGAVSTTGIAISGLTAGSTPSFTGNSFLFTQIDSTNSTAPTLTENLAAGSLSAGQYSYQVTFVTPDGETEFRNNSVGISVSLNSAVTLTNIPTHSGNARITARNIYRTPVGNSVPFYAGYGQPQYLVTTIANNTTTTYQDTMSDATLKNQTARYSFNDTAGAMYIKTEQLSTQKRLLGLGYDIDSIYGTNMRGFVGFGPSNYTRIYETGQVIFNNAQLDQTAKSYPSRNVGFTWFIDTDNASMGVKELASDVMEYGFYTGDNDSGDYYRFQMNNAWNGRQNDKNYVEFSGLDSTTYSGWNVVGGDLILQGSSLHTMRRENTSTTTANTSIYVDNTLPPPATNGLTLTGSSAAYTGTSDTTFFVKITSVGTPSAFAWRQGGTPGDLTGYSAPINITGAAQTLTAGVTVTFNQTTGGIVNQVYHFRVLAPSRLHIDYGGVHYMNGSYLIGGTGAATAKAHLAAGTTAASTAPLKFTSGVNLTTAEAGAMEYNGTNLFFTRTGTTRENVLVAVDNATAPTAVASPPTLTSYFGTDTIALTTPNRWLSVNILGSVYKIALYT